MKLHDPQIRAALGLGPIDESLYLQQQRDFQRDFHLRQLLLQDQLDQQSRLDSMVVEQRLKQLREHLQDFPELQQHYGPLLLHDRLHRDHDESNLFARAQLQQHEELQRRALGQGQPQTQQHSPIGQYVQQKQASGQAQADGKGQEACTKSSNVQHGAHSALRDIAADSLAGNAIKRSEMEKRVFAKPEEVAIPVVAAKKRPRASTEDSGDGDRKKSKKKKEKSSKKAAEGPSALAELGKVASEAIKQPTTAKQASSTSLKQAPIKPSAQALLDFASSVESCPATPRTPITALGAKVTLHGTFVDLINAAESEEKSGQAAFALTNIKNAIVEWSDDDEAERELAIKRGDTIHLPNFTSILPQLPEEPEFMIAVKSLDKKKRKKFKGILDDDSVDTKASNKAKEEKKDILEPLGPSKPAEAVVIDYPYPIDTWWPSVQNIRKERKQIGEPQDEDNFEGEEDELEQHVPFRANMPKIKEKFTQEVAPGVLEKLPHCRIHRMLMKKRKNAAAPEFVYCFQVTELYPNDIMVCCSHCGTWRHTACGGHYKPYSVRECIDAPFTAVCDRCHVEEKILRDFPSAKKRIDRQRNEQVRRGLATSAAMRQASFSKHGGTYKWPLGSVSATHIGGHTRSVWHRHDKADKQWMDMAQRLSKSHGFRQKERVKVRTKELERLLVSVEDAGKLFIFCVLHLCSTRPNTWCEEGHTDRHNMMLFLLQDTLRDVPIGFQKRRKNIFDPEEDEAPADIAESSASVSNGLHHPITGSIDESKVDVSVSDAEVDEDQDENEDDESQCSKKVGAMKCARENCHNKPRFDSVFCSDACGVACLESDLLRSFHYTSDMHPSLLRS